MLKYALILLTAAFLGGCSSLVVREEPQTIRLGLSGVKCDSTALVETLLSGRPGVKKHALAGHWRKHNFTAECVLKSEAGRFTAIFLAPHMRLATLTLTPPHTITFDCAKEVPTSLKPEYLIFDLALVNLPLAQLRNALGDEFQVEELVNTRRVCAAGREIANVSSRPDGGKTYENLEFDYGYTIREVR